MSNQKQPVVPTPVGGLSVISDKKVPFNIRIVRPGDLYGRNHSLVHDDAIKYGPMVEFYDARTAGHDTKDWGYFVSRYYVSTLYEGTNGIALDGPYRDYDVDAATLNLVRSWLRNQLNSNGGENASTRTSEPDIRQPQDRSNPG